MNPQSSRTPFNRRTFLSLAAAGGMSATLAACGGGTSPRDANGADPVAADDGEVQGLGGRADGGGGCALAHADQATDIFGKDRIV